MTTSTKKDEAESVGAPRGLPEDTRKALAAWDAGEIVWTIEMGGLGPGYEQCIQILVFEIVRDNEPLPTKDFGRWGEAAIKRCDPGLGFSGAQVGAARGLAFRFLKFGHRATLDKAEQDRRIQVSRTFPQPPALTGNASAPKAPPEAVAEAPHGK